MEIQLNTLNNVRKFTQVVSKYDGDVIAISEQYRVNAKSMLGLLSLNILGAIKVEFYGESDDEIINKIKGLGIVVSENPL